MNIGAFVAIIGFPALLVLVARVAGARGTAWSIAKNAAALWAVAGSASFAAVNGWLLTTLLMVFIALLIVAADLRAAKREAQ